MKLLTITPYLLWFSLCACAADATSDEKPRGGERQLQDQSPQAVVWRDTSARVRVATFSYWDGGSRYERATSDLTQDQIAALRSLKLEVSDDGCAADVLNAAVTVTDEDGSEETYRIQGESCDSGEVVLEEDSLLPFLATFDCLSASETRFRETTPEDAPLIQANDGCVHGLFGSAPWLMLEVTTPGVPYKIAGVDCEHNDVKIDLYDQQGATLLRAGAPQEAPGCSEVVHTFAEAGTYALRIEGTLGDYFLAVSHE